ncbi:MAG: DUF502 domain-containing protein [Calditrichae bacterium]|nr:DUF502 domain-containing protein [Calditrichota bacterium]MCB9059762.1 DUF502 domain-containing protein [Calditrichia bacterium]
MKDFKLNFKRHFFSGLLVVVPVAITFWILEAIFLALDNILRPILEPQLGYWPLGLGIVFAFAFVWLIGLMASNFFVSRFLKMGESFVYKIPIAKVVYSAVKQILETFARNEKQSFKRVVLVEYPSPGIWSVGFVNGETSIPGHDEKKLNILIFASLNPSSGYFILVPESKTIPLNISVEDGLKWTVSGGIVKPGKIL